MINALLAEELAKRHRVTVLTSSGPGLSPMGVENNVRVVRVPVYFRRNQATANLISMLMYLLMAIREGGHLLKHESFDVINTHFALPSGPVGQWLSRRAGIPNVLSLHGGDLYDPSKFTSPHRHPVLRIWIRRLIRRADRVIGQSTNTLNNLKQYYLPQLDAIRIPLGIKRPKIEAGDRKSYGIPEDEVLLVTVGRLIARKAIHQLLILMKSFRDLKIRLLVIGTGPQEEQLRRDSQQIGINNKVQFLGQVSESEKFRILQMSDIYVSTSQHEGFGMVFLEAMACGIPVICYDYGGQTDFLKDQKNGYLIPLNNLKEFEARCLFLVQNQSLRKKMGQDNSRRVEELFIDRCAEQYESIFYEVIDGRR
ncbi:MAG TPA: glycosyltransferase family 4 protein [Nitrospiria bacterium]